MTVAADAQITVNGEVYRLAGMADLGALLERLDVRPGAVVVELNGVIYRRGEGLDRALASGDVVEIVHFVGGG